MHNCWPWPVRCQPAFQRLTPCHSHNQEKYNPKSFTNVISYELPFFSAMFYNEQIFFGRLMVGCSIIVKSGVILSKVILSNYSHHRIANEKRVLAQFEPIRGQDRSQLAASFVILGSLSKTPLTSLLPSTVFYDRSKKIFSVHS